MHRLASLVRRAQQSNVLEYASLTYVSLPFLVFVAGWIQPWVSVPCVLVVVAGLLRQPASRVPEVSRPGQFDLAAVDMRSWLAFAFIVGLVLFIVLYSGTGGYAHQYGGHWRHNSFVKDLASHAWPLGFEDVGSSNEPGVLAFYLANAILPSLVASVLGWEAGFFFHFVWTLLAVVLTLCWFMRVIGAWSPRWVLFFLFFGGLDIIGYSMVLGPYPGINVELDLWMGHLAFISPEMGNTFWLFPANLTILFNSPHHVLCSWLVLLMILDDTLHAGTSYRTGLLCAFGLLWSAFSFVGLAPFVILSLIWTRGRGMWSFENLAAGVCVLLVTGLYIGSNNGDYVHGPVWLFQDLAQTGLLLLLVFVLEFGVHVALLQQTEARREGLAHPAWRWTAVVTLICISLYRIGDNCDFTTKASIPALLVLQLCIAYALGAARWRRPVAGWLLVGVLLVGTISPLTLVARSVGKGLDTSAPPIDRVAPTNELERRSRGGQLFSDGEAFFWRVLARPIVYQPQVEWAPEAKVSAMRQLRRALREAREAKQAEQETPGER
jgi:hypothetical protein